MIHHSLVAQGLPNLKKVIAALRIIASDLRTDGTIS